MGSFKLKFRGTRGSYPTPKPNFLEFGGNTSCVEIMAGERLIILDGGYGIIDLGNELIKSKKAIKALILLSHVHMDHIQGLPFFAPIYQSSKIDIMGLNPDGENLKEILNKSLFDKVFPLGLEDVKSNINIQNFSDKFVIILKENEEPKLELAKNIKNIKLDHEDVLISSYKYNSHPEAGSLSIKIQYNNKTLVYATDFESSNNDDDFIEFSKNADVMIHDAQYTVEDYKKGYGHSTYETAIENAIKANVKELFFFHYDPNYDDEKLRSLEEKYQKLSPNYKFAKENLEVIL